MTFIRNFAASAAAIVALGTAAQAADIVETATSDARLSTLVAAITAADLVETLKGPGPFTVYAPVNEGFSALPAGTVGVLLQPENKERLTSVLLYHVDDRLLTSDKIPEGPTSFKPLLTSERLCITKTASGVSIADGTGKSAMVVVADIKADNGVIHLIDKVLIPGTRPVCR